MLSADDGCPRCDFLGPGSKPFDDGFRCVRLSGVLVHDALIAEVVGCLLCRQLDRFFFGCRKRHDFIRERDSADPVCGFFAHGINDSFLRLSGPCHTPCGVLTWVRMQG